MKLLSKIGILLAGICFFNQTPALAQNDYMRAMEDELQRSMQELKLDKLQKPYYIEYTLKLRDTKDCDAVLGSIRDSKNEKRASLNVVVRVGDYKFDNTNFFDFGMSFFGSGDREEVFRSRRITFEPDYNSLRREFWLATDAAYKRVAESFTKKETVLKNRIRQDTIPDFTKMGAEEFYDTLPIPAIDYEKIKELCKELSGEFRNYPDVFTSTASFEYNPETTYYINSEGRKYIKREHVLGLEIAGASQAVDGMPVGNFFSIYVFNPKDLPSKDSLKRAVKMIAEKIIALRTAPVLEEAYSGPVLFEGQAAAEVFAQVFAPCLAVQREQLTESGRQENDRFTAFQSKIGGRVLPEYLSVNAVPSKESYDNMPLVGAYKFDDEGVKAEDILLVKDGFLKTLLSGRIPVKRVKTSNGHSRGGAAMIDVLEVNVSEEKVVTDADLREKMMQLCKDRELPFGIVIKKAMNTNILNTTIDRITDGSFIEPKYGKPSILTVEVYKLYPDGREELMRGIEAAGFTTQSFKDIIGAGSSKYVLNYLAQSVTSSYISGGDPWVHATVIVPNLLFEDGEIKPLQDDFTKPPILENPVSSKK